MSIVINGMDMPKGNSTKNLLIYSDGRVFTGHKDDVNYSAEELKTGMWIEDGYSHYKAVCSECGEPCATYVMNTPRDRFCKWCGADMRGAERREE